MQVDILYHLLTNLIKQVINYHNRLLNMTSSGSEALVCQAYNEQANSKLPWLNSLKQLQTVLTPHIGDNIKDGQMNPSLMKERLQNIFECAWRIEVESQSKPYLQLLKHYKEKGYNKIKE